MTGQEPVYCRYPHCGVELTSPESRRRGYGRRHYELLFPRAAVANRIPGRRPAGRGEKVSPERGRDHSPQPDLLDELDDDPDGPR